MCSSIIEELQKNDKRHMIEIHEYLTTVKPPKSAEAALVHMDQDMVFNKTLEGAKQADEQLKKDREMAMKEALEYAMVR